MAIHWFYSDVEVIHAERIPARGPVLIAMNHQNALIDALLALTVIPRDLRITAKATIGESLPGALLMKAVGIIPLQRATDSSGSTDPIRNRHSFQAMIDELAREGAILVFPEGKSHNDPEVAPLKTGLARVALRARESGVSGIQIIPIGITFENKAELHTRVSAEVGDPLQIDDWAGDDARELTTAVAQRLATISMVRDFRKLPPPSPAQRNDIVRLAAWWGRVMHEGPLRITRHLAKKASSDPGEPAMYTVIFGFGAILLSYLIEVAIVSSLFGWMIAALFLASLITGAYWAAYAEHPTRRS
ncbi:MAG: 1-acyl-sn-glycerol-3-phosphate acyltransferase [Gemmatimonadaceae bacterium]